MDITFIKTVIRAGADVNLRGYNGKTALHFAAHTGNPAVVETLVNAGADPNIRDDDGFPVIMLASSNGKTGMVDQLIRGGANLSMEVNGVTALHATAANGNLIITKMLLQAGAMPNQETSAPNSPLQLALTNCFNLNVFCINSIYVSDHHNCTELEFLCNLDLVEELLKAGAMIEPDHLSSAAYSNNIAGTKLLLEYGANVNQVDSNGVSPLVSSMIDYNPDIVDILLTQPDINVNCCLPKDDCVFPLVNAVFLSNMTLLTELIKKGANPNIELERCGPIALRSAFGFHETDESLYQTLSLLIDAGADVQRDFYIEDLLYYPLIMTIEKNFTQSSILLLQNGISIASSFQVGIEAQPLKLAIANGNCEIASFLVEKGINFVPQNIGQKSVFHHSSICPNTTKEILQQIPRVNSTNFNSEMKVDIGDEICFNLYQEMQGKVVVINWQRFQWYEYDMDSEALAAFQNSLIRSESVVMVVVAPYNHPFLFMTDFRIFLLNKLSLNSTNSGCSASEKCHQVPDLFSLVMEKVSDVFLACDFYSPVMESLRQETAQTQMFLMHRQEIFIAMMLFFCIFALPLNFLLFNALSNLRKSKVVGTNIEQLSIANNEKLDICCDCLNLTNKDEAPKVEEKIKTKRKMSNKIKMIITASFFSFIGLANLYAYQLAKKGINYLVESAISTSTYKSSLWVILVFKFINTLFIDYQPGSPCAGAIFEDQYNIKLSFWLADIEDENVLLQTQERDFKKHIALSNSLTNETFKAIHKSNILTKNITWLKFGISSYKEETNQRTNKIFANFKKIIAKGEERTNFSNPIAKNDPSLLWKSTWLQKKEWETPLFIDIAGKSTAILIHIVTIILFRFLTFFTTMKKLWLSNRISSRIIFTAIVTIALGVNLSSKILCFGQRENVWESLLVRFIMILIVTPSSVLMEWIFLKIAESYIHWCVKVCLNWICKEKSKLAIKHLEDLFISEKDVAEMRAKVSSLTFPIKDKLETVTRHKVELVPTGSVFERYGKPLTSPALDTNLRTDFDVMFAIEKSNLPVEYIMKDDEFLHIFALSNSCLMVNRLTEFHAASKSVKLSANKARKFMKNIVDSADLGKQANGMKTLSRNILSFLFNLPRLGRWNQQITESTGPAANYQERSGGPLTSKEWKTSLDCDFLLSIELGTWPLAAESWAARDRFWPTNQVVTEVLATGCQAVPKADPSGDQFSWRLSFSRGELLLSQHVPQHARLAYVALKVYYKNNLKVICPSLRSYHLKTLFYHFLERNEPEHITNSSVDNLVRNMLHHLQQHLRLRSCPHYFIPSINLFLFSGNPNSDRTNREIELCIKHITKTVKDTSLLVNLFSRQSWNTMLAQHLRENRPVLFGGYVIVILLLNVIAMFGGAFVYACGLFSVIGLLISFIYGALISVPLLCIIFIAYKAIKCVKV
eukprot:GFUD01016215.1.p1 GENE.GFUD01016215.1~~GFUD01016215.1.p1  ORF type:complete len:1587 (-),score=281.46 GFUD01016215.1:23-4294(-)